MPKKKPARSVRREKKKKRRVPVTATSPVRAPARPAPVPPAAPIPARPMLGPAKPAVAKTAPRPTAPMATDYPTVMHDLRKTAILSGAIFSLLIVLSFFLR